MKKLNLVVYLCLFHFALLAQYGIQTNSDSLTQELKRAKTDTARIDLLFRRGLANQFVAPKQAHADLYEALRIARKIRDENRMLGTLLTLGYSYGMTGEPVKSIHLLQEALRYAEKKKEDTSMPLAFLANNYEAQGDLNRALDYARQSYQEYEARLKKKLFLDKRGYPAGPMRLGQLFEKLGQRDSAMYYAKMAQVRIQEMPLEGWYPYFYCQICNLLGHLHMQSNESQEALQFYRTGLREGNRANFPTAINESKLSLAKYYARVNRPDSAIHHAIDAYLGASKIQGFEVMQAAASLLRKTYEKQGNYAKALHYNDLSVAARDSVSGAEKVREVQNLTFQEERRQQKMRQEIESARIAYQNRVKIYSLLAVVGGVLLLTLILYRNNRQKQKANALLQTQKEEINRQRDQVQSSLETLKATQKQLIQSEKLASLGELTAGIAHEIQNPLNFVNNFSDINQELLDELLEEIDHGNLPEIRALAEDLRTNEERINHHGQRASSIVKGMLEHSRQGRDATNRVSTDINALADEYLRLAYHGWRAKDNSFNSKIETHFDPDLPLVSVFPQDIGRVLLNLINNAFYAVHQRASVGVTSSHTDTIYQPTVTIFTQKIGDQIIIKVKDNGDGVPESIRDKIFQPFFTTKPTGQGTGLGLSLAYDIVTKGHGGILDIVSNESEGTMFIVQLPYTK
ncbi:MAG: ATP-binding protein [Haliscomenobacter sp.]|uniref:ATP-binding protein n=1 Tax=Haliscomenobacter sp. TaxID=2717303 RepID=UPI0029BB9F38|nr:ATP-binding protein [Haliscomenobacter sp.]MDX2069134.1 ATP-binding protein [Haliscomenobacter sp.]